MKNNFVNTSNVSRFLTAAASLEDRGAPEASIMLVGGNAGFGKSKTGEWWAVQQDAVYIRVKAAATPHWVLTDLVKLLGEQAAAHSCENLFGQAVGILAKMPRPVVVDEVENTLSNIKVLETLRDISDLVEIPLVLIGREFVYGSLIKYPQIRTRIGVRVDFSEATLADTKKCVDELCEVDVTEDVIKLIHDQSEGHIRETIKAIANVERMGKRNKKTVTLENVKNVTLVHEWQRAKKAS